MEAGGQNDNNCNCYAPAGSRPGAGPRLLLPFLPWGRPRFVEGVAPQALL